MISCDHIIIQPVGGFQAFGNESMGADQEEEIGISLDEVARKYSGFEAKL